MNYDIIIIGGGAAGISAALWCDELGLSAIVLEAAEEFGGQLLWTHNEIKNHLGIEAENGREMRDIFLRQIENRKFERRFNAKVLNLSEQEAVATCQLNLSEQEAVATCQSSFTVFLENGETISANSIVIASGIRRRKLNIEGELKFQNKGIITSGKRDAEKARGKNVLIVGGGDAAFENCLILAETAKSVTLAYRGKMFRARAEFVEQVEQNPKIKVLTETNVKRISGKENVEFVEFENGGRQSFEIIVIRIGVEPNTEFLRGKIELDSQSYIKINENCETSVKNIYAVGDVANPLSPTISTAVGMGATVAKTIFKSFESRL